MISKMDLNSTNNEKRLLAVLIFYYGTKIIWILQNITNNNINNLPNGEIIATAQINNEHQLNSQLVKLSIVLLLQKEIKLGMVLLK